MLVKKGFENKEILTSWQTIFTCYIILEDYPNSLIF